MKCQIIRNELYKRGSINNVINEANRNGREQIQHKNQNIDRSRSHLNISKGISESGYQTWKKNLSRQNLEVPKHKTGNMGQVMITASPEFFKDCGWSIEEARSWKSAKDCPETIRNYFNDARKFMIQYLGAENILSIHLHFDETSPNMHINYIPIHQGTKRKNVWARDSDGKLLRNHNGDKIRERDSNGKVVYEYVQEDKAVSASSYWEARGGKNSYRALQDAFFEQVASRYGLDRGDVGSKRRHRRHQEYIPAIEKNAEILKFQHDEHKELLIENQTLKAQNTEIATENTELQNLTEKLTNQYNERIDTMRQNLQKARTEYNTRIQTYNSQLQELERSTAQNYEAYNRTMDELETSIKEAQEQKKLICDALEALRDHDPKFKTMDQWIKETQTSQDRKKALQLLLKHSTNDKALEAIVKTLESIDKRTRPKQQTHHHSYDDDLAR